MRNGQLAVVSQSELILQRHEWKRNGKRVVCVAGAFDLLHPGHVRLLEQAHSLGDILIVALQSDESVRIATEQADKLVGSLGVAVQASTRTQKSPARPITPAAERAEILAALASVDFVAIFEEATAAEFIARLAPDIFAQGGEGSRENACADDDAIKAAGGQVVRLPLEPGYSTSRLVERITELQA
jgi:bifunctional ADP-heptose synthase (sugar kinase/adenylyltransferase)